MKLTTTRLTFQAVQVDAVVQNGQQWLTMPDIAKMLYRKGVSPSDAPFSKGGGQTDAPFVREVRQLQRLYQRHADEFSESMTKMLKMVTAGGQQMVRVFSLRGAHLIAMFARTDVAKAFRRWVLDILDREVGMPVARPVTPSQLDDDMRRAIQSLCSHAEYLDSWWKRVEPGLRLLNRRLAGAIHDDFVHAVIASRQVVRGLGLKSNTRCAAGYPWEAGYTERSMYIERMQRELA